MGSTWGQHQPNYRGARPCAKAEDARHTGGGGSEGRGSHSSTFQLNLSRFWHKHTLDTPFMPPKTC